MRLPVAPATAPARLWLAAVASAAVIGGAYLLESHGHSWAAAGLVAAVGAGSVPRVLVGGRTRPPRAQGPGTRGATPNPPPRAYTPRPAPTPRPPPAPGGR